MTEPTMIIKIVVAGEGGVGKTTLLFKYVSGKFVHDTSMTIGVQLHSKNIKLNDRNYALQLWDLGGQDRFRFILPSYVLGARGAILLYDTTRMTSLETLEEWIGICRYHKKDLPILLCGAKADLTEYRSVPVEYAMDFVEKFKLCGHLEVSSKTGLNVENAFEMIIKKIFEAEQKGS